MQAEGEPLCHACTALALCRWLTVAYKVQARPKKPAEDVRGADAVTCCVLVQAWRAMWYCIQR